MTDYKNKPHQPDKKAEIEAAKEKNKKIVGEKKP